VTLDANNHSIIGVDFTGTTISLMNTNGVIANEAVVNAVFQPTTGPNRGAGSMTGSLNQ
jgi:hypothetical protein